MLVVIALGGDALARREEPLAAAHQRADVELAAATIASVARDHRVVVTHGNGPQVGLLSLQDLARREVDAYPLDVLGAESEGMVGYLLEQELGHHLPSGRLVCLLTQVEVDPDDPAFAAPSTSIGPMYGHEEAERLARERGWRVAPDGAGWRRVVASPEPIRVVESTSIELLVSNHVTTICTGGGGIPVAPDANGDLQGVEAVVDTDLATALLATEIGADALLLLTDVDAVYADWGTPRQRPLGETSIAELRSLDLPAGSLGPKVEAACRFVASGGALAAIGSLSAAPELLRGRAGTWLLGCW